MYSVIACIYGCSHQKPDFVHSQVKMDVEGIEFEILNTLMKKGKIQLIDRLTWECHDFGAPKGDSCNKMSSRLRKVIEVPRLATLPGSHSFSHN